MVSRNCLCLGPLSTARCVRRADIDLMVEFEPGERIGLIRFESFVEELESLAGRRVDLVTKRGLKPWVRPKVLKDAPSSMRHEASFLKDIFSAYQKIESIVESTSEDLFLKDEILPAAVLHHLTGTGSCTAMKPNTL